MASAPVSILKTLISLIQLFAACNNVGIIDAAERTAQEAPVPVAPATPKKAE